MLLILIPGGTIQVRLLILMIEFWKNVGTIQVGVLFDAGSYHLV